LTKLSTFPRRNDADFLPAAGLYLAVSPLACLFKIAHKKINADALVHWTRAPGKICADDYVSRACSKTPGFFALSSCPVEAK
jgi:hypothetical protein